MSSRVEPWQVWWADFDPQVSREQAGLRPAVIVGTSFACRLPNDLLFVVPCTTTDRGLPFQPRVGSAKRPSFVMCDQLKSVSRRRLQNRHRMRLHDQEIESIKFALRQLIDTR